MGTAAKNDPRGFVRSAVIPPAPTPRAGLTLFNRESQAARTAHFQVSLAEQAPDGQFLVSTMAFGLEAKSAVTPVLFFKIRKGQATLKHHRGQVTINTGVLDQVKEELQTKLKKHAEA